MALDRTAFKAEVKADVREARQLLDQLRGRRRLAASDVAEMALHALEMTMRTQVALLQHLHDRAPHD